MILTEPKIIVPNQHLAKVYHQMGLGVHAYEEDSLWTPDSDLWESCVLNMRLSDYPPNLTYAWDRSRYQNHGTITGTAYGRQGRSFDGTDDLITVAHQAYLNPTLGGTIIAWFNASGMGETAGRICQKTATGIASDGGYMYYLKFT